MTPAIRRPMAGPATLPRFRPPRRLALAAVFVLAGCTTVVPTAPRSSTPAAREGSVPAALEAVTARTPQVPTSAQAAASAPGTAASAAPGGAAVAAPEATLPTTPVIPAAPGDATVVPQPTPSERPVTFWTVPQLSPDAPGGGALAGILTRFRSENPDLGLVVSIRPASGPAGIAAFLASTDRVVPSEMPDVAVIPLSEVRAAEAQGLLQPVPAAVPTDRVADAFPFARAQTTKGDRAWAVPLALDFAHVVSRDGAPPRSWSEALADGPLGIYVGGAEEADLAPLLALYGAAGGDLAALPAAEPTAAAAAWGFLARSSEEGVLVTPTAGQSAVDAWQRFADGTWPAAFVSAGSIASRLADVPGAQWAPIPGPDGAAPPVGWGWALVVTGGGAQRAAAARLIALLTEPENRGWVLDHGFLPAWRSDLAEQMADLAAPPPQGYAEFAAAQLESASGVDQPGNWSAEWVSAANEVLAGGDYEMAVSTATP